MAAAVADGPPGRLALLVDEATSRRFLVDTGSAVSILPHHSVQPPFGPAIKTADGTPIKCWGRQLSVIIAGGRRLEWNFVLADIAFPIVGADFLQHFGLQVDLAARTLSKAGQQPIKLAAPVAGGVYAAIGLVTDGRGSTTSLPTVEALRGAQDGHLRPDQSRPPAAAQQVQDRSGGNQPPVQEAEVVRDFPEVVNNSRRMPPIRHKIVHVIETTCQRPVTARYRRLDPLKLEAARREFAELEKQGIVQRSNSSWSSPLHMVKKADGSWRPCGDYRRLNLVTKPDLYPPPHMEDLTAKLAGCCFFSKIDLRKGYHQILVAAADVPKTAIITPFGLFEFKRTPFGLRNAGQTFQRFMDEIFAGLPFVFVYLDDILVASRTRAEHRRHLKEVFARLKTHGLVINREKCVFYADQVEYLGHVVSAAGVAPLPARVEAITAFPPPANRGQLMSFLGMVNFYRRFIRGAASLLKPLTDSTRGPGGKTMPVKWTCEMEKSFAAAKAALIAATALDHPEQHAELALAVDASDHHVGAALQQLTARGWRPLAFFSRKMSTAESKYSTFDRELLACVSAVRHFRFLLEGRQFHILTDHKPLTHALHRISDPWSARQQRHLAYVAEYTADIRHVAGVDNVVADALSRPADPQQVAPDGHLRPERCQSPATDDETWLASIVPPSKAVPVPWADLAAAQPLCADVAKCRESSVLQLQEVNVQGSAVLCDAATGVLRPLVPAGFRRQIFDQVHGLSHAGTRASTRLISSRFMWPGLAADIKSWCRECVTCNTAKAPRQEKTPLEPIPIPQVKFSHVHVDLLGPWPAADGGFTHLLTVIDRTTRWPEVCPLRGTSAEDVLQAFISRWVARFGVPSQITSNRGGAEYLFYVGGVM